MFSIAVDYPSFDEELEIVTRTTGAPITPIEQIIDRATLCRYQDAVLSIVVAPDVVRHAVAMASATRPGEGRAPELVERFVAWGAGPRASQHLILGAKARAALRGQPHAAIEDVNALAHAVLGHRVLINFQGEAERISARDIVDAVLAHIR
jgi:MoxR-like ATPase